MALLFPVCYAWAADVNGKVTDGNSAALSGVTVSIKGKKIATVSDASGNYSISASQGSVLVFSYVGFITKEIKIGTETELNVILSENKEALGEVVVKEW